MPLHDISNRAALLHLNGTKPPPQRCHISTRTLVLLWCYVRVAEVPGEAPDGCSAHTNTCNPPPTVSLCAHFQHKQTPTDTLWAVYSTQQKGSTPLSLDEWDGGRLALKFRANDPKCIRWYLQKTSDDPLACIIYHPAVGNQRGCADERHRCLLAFMFNFVPFFVVTY